MKSSTYPVELSEFMSLLILKIYKIRLALLKQIHLSRIKLSNSLTHISCLCAMKKRLSSSESSISHSSLTFAPRRIKINLSL